MIRASPSVFRKAIPTDYARKAMNDTLAEMQHQHLGETETSHQTLDK